MDGVRLGFCACRPAGKYTKALVYWSESKWTAKRRLTSATAPSVLFDEELILPCIYAAKGFKADNQVYVFIDSDDLSGPRHIRTFAGGLAEYLLKARSLGLTPPLSSSPSRTPTHALSRSIKAVVQRHPHHHRRYQMRRTRYTKGVMIVFRSKRIFDILFSSDAKRTSALSKVTVLVVKYDPIPVSPNLKNYGEPDSREFQQYFLMDENVPATTPYAKLSAWTEPEAD
ncbi:hypothetical protein AN958_02546 [Leucoagaricus sp. SymC.cos]|nr:hypothetical protein AN958_02546 [Leucoagaricus sp. SymC.cos]